MVSKLKKFSLVFVIMVLVLGAGNRMPAYAGDSVAQTINKAALEDKDFEGCAAKLLDPSFPPDLKTKMNPNYVYTWFTYIVPSSASTSWPFFNKEMGEAKENFTEQGWQEFNAFLDTLDFRNFLSSHPNSNSVRSFFTTAPSLFMEGEISDASNKVVGYRWVFRASLQSTFSDAFSESAHKTEKVSRLMISVVSEGEARDLKIESWKPDSLSKTDGVSLEAYKQLRKSFVWKNEQSSKDKQ